jgi:hypothetical protein
MFCFKPVLLSSFVIALMISVGQFPEKVSSSYVLESRFAGASFLENFWFWTAHDPAGGFVSYQSAQSASAQNLTRVSANNTVFISADASSIAPNGRKSVRIQSKKNWNSGLFLLDLFHMPSGCGTWPAWWFNGPDPWPTHGEVDVIEGVNKMTANQVALHTTPGCNIPVESQNVFTGYWSVGSNGSPATNCDINAPDQWTNQGCAIMGPENSFGSEFNSRRGGIYAMEWTPTVLQMFFFPRNSIPGDLNSNSPTPSQWGLPFAKYTLGSGCSPNHFRNLSMILNTDFCGGWATDLFAQHCPAAGDCVSYVKNNPCAFVQAYWEIASIRVFQQNVQPSSPPPGAGACPAVP